MPIDTASIMVRLGESIGKRWSGTVPFEMRDPSKLVLRARGFTDGRLEVPAGNYLVSAILPDGQHAVADDVVELKPGDNKELVLSVGNLDIPASFQQDSFLTRAIAGVVRPVATLFSSQSAALVSGNWLKPLLEPAGRGAALKRQRLSRSKIEVTAADSPVLLEITSGNADRTHFAIPVDENGRTAVEWHVDDQSGLPAVRFDFNRGDLNSFFDYIQTGLALEARSISRPLIEQSETYLMDKTRSPLHAVLGAYVLLRANEVGALDVWTDRLYTYCKWLPDCLAVRVEYLARVARHQEAVKYLLELTDWGAPWFRSGVGYLAQRAAIYADIADARKQDFPIEPPAQEQLRKTASVLAGLGTRLDPTRSACAFRGLSSMLEPAAL
jgi:hypothetical protein